MRVDRLLRLVLIGAILLVFLLALVALLYLTESVFTVWDRLMQAPLWLRVLYGAVVAAFAAGTFWLIWRLVVPGRSVLPVRGSDFPREDELVERLQKSATAGVDTGPADREIQRLQLRRESAQVYIAMFGEISTGKSALIRALLADAAAAQQIEVSVRGGSTREIRDYMWQSANGNQRVLTDVPGLNESGALLEDLAREEALRAHVIVFVCDGDLTRRQYDALAGLAELGRPTILALNKADLLTGVDQQQLRDRLHERIESLQPSAGKDALMSNRFVIVTVSAATSETVTRVHADGTEEQAQRPCEPRVEALRAAIDHMIRADLSALEKSRDRSVFVLAARKLDRAEAEFREQTAADIVRQYTRRAVIGAMAAVAPGTDLLIQGLLGTGMVRDLCALYGSPVKELDAQQFLDMSQKRVARAVPIVLAVAGNGLKAFPGLGTVAGGLTHAVAYGIIFDALGRSLAEILARGEGLRSRPAAALFEEKLSENLEARARRIAKLALSQGRRRD